MLPSQAHFTHDQSNGKLEWDLGMRLLMCSLIPRPSGPSNLSVATNTGVRSEQSCSSCHHRKVPECPRLTSKKALTGLNSRILSIYLDGSQSDMEIITAQKGGEALIWQGYKFTLKRTMADGKKYWRCSKKSFPTSCCTVMYPIIATMYLTLDTNINDIIIFD